jgi:hypothetical protein
MQSSPKKIPEQGLVSVLKQVHDEPDAAVFDAYGWPVRRGECWHTRWPQDGVAALRLSTKGAVQIQGVWLSLKYPHG